MPKSMNDLPIQLSKSPSCPPLRDHPGSAHSGHPSFPQLHRRPHLHPSWLRPTHSTSSQHLSNPSLPKKKNPRPRLVGGMPSSQVGGLPGGVCIAAGRAIETRIVLPYTHSASSLVASSTTTTTITLPIETAAHSSTMNCCEHCSPSLKNCQPNPRP
jgi:hypothetical protein